MAEKTSRGGEAGEKSDRKEGDSDVEVISFFPLATLFVSSITLA